jgi:hypothetical protein
MTTMRTERVHETLLFTNGLVVSYTCYTKYVICGDVDVFRPLLSIMYRSSILYNWMTFLTTKGMCIHCR